MTATRPTIGARLAAWAALLGGVSVSLAGNIAHARPDDGPRMLAAVTPLALALMVEVLVRVPWQRGWRSLLAQVLTLGVGGVAAVVSYSHLHALAIRYGESGLTAALTPLAVDGVAAGGALAVVEIGRAAQRAVDLALTAEDLPRLSTTEPAAADRTADKPVVDEELSTTAEHDGPVVAVEAIAGPRLQLVPGPAEGDGPDPDDPGPAGPAPTGPDRSAPRRKGSASGPDPLLPAARACAAAVEGRGQRLTRSALTAELRGRGHRLGTDRARELLTAVRTTRPTRAAR